MSFALQPGYEQIEQEIRRNGPAVLLREYGATGHGDETMQIRAAATRAMNEHRALQAESGVTYTLDSLTFDYSADTPDAAAAGFRAVPIYGGGPRSTIFQQVAGATDPLISYIGADSGNSHNGKVTGILIDGIEMRGTGGVDANGRGTGSGPAAIKLSIYQFAVLRNLYISRFGTGIVLDRPIKSATRDDMSHELLIESVKIFQNGGWGITCTGNGSGSGGTNAIGHVGVINCDASYNGGGGYDLVSNQISLFESSALANGQSGLKATAPSNPLSTGYGPMLYGFRCEGNCASAPSTYPEIVIDGGFAPSLYGVVVLASAGGDCVVIGNGSNQTRFAKISGGVFSGAGSAGRVGQRAIVLGGNSLGAQVEVNIATDQFADSFSSNNPMAVVADSGNSSRLSFFGTQQRSVYQGIRAAATDQVLEASVFGDTQRRFSARADGRLAWGSGSATVDIGLQRGAADRLMLDDGDMFKTGNFASLPTASSQYRGYIARVQGGVGIADAFYICEKNASDAYVWRTI